MLFQVPISNNELRLKRRLLQAIVDPSIRPVVNANDTVVVVTRIFPIKIQEIIEKEEVLNIGLRIQLGWVDQRMKWNPDNFSGIDTAILPSHAVWVPDLQFMNAAEDMYYFNIVLEFIFNLKKIRYSFLASRRFAVKIHSNGEVWWHPTGSVKLRCSLELALFPVCLIFR